MTWASSAHRRLAARDVEHPRIGGEGVELFSAPRSPTETPPHRRGGGRVQVRRPPPPRLLGEAAARLPRPGQQKQARPDGGRVGPHDDHDDDDGDHQHPGCWRSPGRGCSWDSVHEVSSGQLRCLGRQFYRHPGLGCKSIKLPSSPMGPLRPSLTNLLRSRHLYHPKVLYWCGSAEPSPCVSGGCLNAKRDSDASWGLVVLICADHVYGGGF